MKCPFCGFLESKVLDSRISKEMDTIRRRRECLKCAKRFTTAERLEEGLPLVIKKDDRREVFDRLKILNGLKKACEKRPISITHLEKIVSRIEYTLLDRGEREIKASDIGSMVMEELKRLDDIAYVRFASVYRQFRDINELMDELKGLLLKKDESP
ncbi:MAG TPA: transcriptional regulator NrdR [Syntrophorhabdus sp.]|jgi:transcriptional repressor NrdR|nr:transcriptional repressor NrdR [Syntrophorhabdus sp.]OPX98078.1 MAG: Transcriptional repressor NrdR [Syntrophorhabdus sp. PtaB.Bin027]OQB75786.1 MAG: Transcriptional repressor NrdR [Deltaproteobacteria bacterium ADurb.Bin135]MBP8745023.1 transcriptional repressor NrdR [Syntrophorhabdus sp.]NMC95108.1 transcriptional repressor NrdR [Syntrophorhabdus sp.]